MAGLSSVGELSSSLGLSSGAAVRILLVEDAYQTSGRQGTGLGLALTKRLVQQHGGSVKLEREEGEGTEITTTLPSTRILATRSPAAKVLHFMSPARCAPRRR